MPSVCRASPRKQEAAQEAQFRNQSTLHFEKLSDPIREELVSSQRQAAMGRMPETVPSSVSRAGKARRGLALRAYFSKVVLRSQGTIWRSGEGRRARRRLSFALALSRGSTRQSFIISTNHSSARPRSSLLLSSRSLLSSSRSILSRAARRPSFYTPLSAFSFISCLLRSRSTSTSALSYSSSPSFLRSCFRVRYHSSSPSRRRPYQVSRYCARVRSSLALPSLSRLSHSYPILAIHLAYADLLASCSYSSASYLSRLASFALALYRASKPVCSYSIFNLCCAYLPCSSSRNYLTADQLYSSFLSVFSCRVSLFYILSVSYPISLTQAAAFYYSC